MREKGYAGYCFLIVGFIYIYFTIGTFGTPAVLAQELGKAFLFISIIFLSIGVLELVLVRRRAKVRSVQAKGYEYLEAFPYFCENCKRFTFRILEYCEECGIKGCVRGASYGDYEKYVRKD